MKTRSSSAVIIGGVTMEYLENPYQVKDYQMITKHLREKVHLERLQGRRARRGRLGTTTSLQHRGLHNFPMQYNREDIRSAKWSPENKRLVERRTNVTKVDSSAQKQHSKDMFDFAVKNAPPKGEKADRSAIKKEIRTSKRSRMASNYSLGRESTGPTPDGSALYNNRTRLLNAIRTRPHTDTACRYNHERSSSQQSIRDTMSQKSSMYQLLDLNPQKQRIGSSSSCASSSLLFVPRSQGSVYSEVFDLGSNHRPSTVTDLLSEMDVSDVHRHYEDSLGDWHDRDGGHEVTKSHHDFRHLLPPSTPCSMNLVTLDEESSSESESEVDEPEVPKVEQPLPQSPKKGRAVTLPEPEVTEEPAPSPKLILKGPHCWVDDATVTSSHSDGEKNLENLENNPAAETETKPANGQPNKSVTDNKEKNVTDSKDKKATEAKTAPGNPVDGINGDVKSAEKQVDTAKSKSDNEEEINSLDNSLPPFICPSSEKKSREAAIKDWLYSSHNLFSCPRSVPML